MKSLQCDPLLWHPSSEIGWISRVDEVHVLVNAVFLALKAGLIFHGGSKGDCLCPLEMIQ